MCFTLLSLKREVCARLKSATALLSIQEYIVNVPFTKIQKENTLSKLFTTEVLSIKKLTLLGFTLVALPLVVGLIYSVMQVNQMSSQASKAIFSVANLAQTNRELNENQLKLERLASQYLILKDASFKQHYLAKEQETLSLVDEKLVTYNDQSLTDYGHEFTLIISKIHHYISSGAVEGKTLAIIEQHFIALAKITQHINRRSNALINQQSSKIETAASQVSRTMLIGLVMIAVTLMIAGCFVFLITSPLKLLTEKIRSIAQGDFDKQFIAKGPPEVRAIAEALEIMRLRLHALELQKSSFIRHISHELKTPLAAIREGTELLYDNSVGKLSDDQQEICHIIKTSVNRLQHLIEDLLDFNIVLDSTSLQDSERIALKPLVASVLHDHKLDIQRKQLVIRINIDNLIIQSNVKQLTVILDNLLSNAIKYSKEKGLIVIACELSGSQCVMAIEDHGIGIAEEIKDKIFDAFYQGAAPENSQIKGSGLGLTIVKELLMRLNGEITILPQGAKKNGTKIQITLPRAEQTDE